MPSKRHASWRAVWPHFHNGPSAPTAGAYWGSGRGISRRRPAPSIWVASRCSNQGRLGRGRVALPEVAAGTGSNCLDNACLDNDSRGAMGPVGVGNGKEAGPTFESGNRQLAGGFTDKEVEQLTGMLRRLSENARRLSA